MSDLRIPFNIPYYTGREKELLREAIDSEYIAGNGPFTGKCQEFFENRWGFRKCLLTSSCTDALEMCALLLDIKEGDEVIVPSYTFVSSALAFVRQGARVVFVDSRSDHPGMDESTVAGAVTERTRAIVVVHYAGVACNMEAIMAVARDHNIPVIEDAAQAIDGSFDGQPLGGIGDFGCFSFHETKNIHCGEGGMLVINSEQFIERSEVIWEKGTNRSRFFRGEIDKYGWIDTGSSFLTSDLSAALLLSQLEAIDEIQSKRLKIWKRYDSILRKRLPGSRLPFVPDYSTVNAHNYYVIADSAEHRDKVIKGLRSSGIYPVFHYLPLHQSDYYLRHWDKRSLPEAERYGDRLLRLPFYVTLKLSEVDEICEHLADLM